MAIVWPCSLSVDEYLAAGRLVAVERPDCPGCARPMTFWSGYERSIRCGGTCSKLWVRRAWCRACRITQGLIPAFCLLGRLDVVGVIGEVITAAVTTSAGVRPAAERADVPHTTARDWVRRFARRAALLAAGFAALVVELTGVAPEMTDVERSQLALAAISAAFAAHSARAGPGDFGLWGFVAIVTGGTLLTTNTNPPWWSVGGRRWIPPVA